jgi:SWI/SNF-related matrix-associated actin-dependent regulator of chromatin subfamily B protein 1
MNNFDSDPEDFAKTFCDDLGIQDPEVGVSKATTLLSVLPLYLIRLNVDSSRPTLPYSLQPAVAFAIREQLYEVTTFTAYLLFLLLFFFFWLELDAFRFTISICYLLCQTAVQSVAAAREIRMSKKGRRGAEYVPARFLSQVLSYSCY